MPMRIIKTRHAAVAAVDPSDSVQEEPPVKRCKPRVEICYDAVEDLNEEMKRMEKKSRGRSISLKKKNCAMVAEEGSYFPILSLPNELIAHVLSFLPIEDRLRARVSKRLDQIEAESKYFVKKLTIIELSDLKLMDRFKERIPDFEKLNTFRKRMKAVKQQLRLERQDRDYQEIIFLNDSSHSSDCFRRISQNASIGELSIKLNLCRDEYNKSFLSNREAYSLIKNFDIDSLALQFKGRTDYNEVVNKSFLLGLTSACKKLEIFSFLGSSFELLRPTEMLELFNVVADRDTKFEYLSMKVNTLFYSAFLSFLGITKRDGVYFASRDIEAFMERADDRPDPDVHFFDGNVEIWVSTDKVYRPTGYGTLNLHFHETESLEQAKYGGNLARIDVYAV
ncbi:hypothetical protein PMAYCL1PPCAC_31568 [Pristionchus mayeri]|uniref:F-box domain-containing protein n=1 Tax=Pristionchus mayeri TaxID=1317129 RepID=A0AAN5DDW8_9BILA|nr:hypothetical protein PMAYCL1PPCAC_31567 [Pristionchus mayeri]GMR61373.1 hypothetical protein PMAYCL1PPCAC_31568 [Pristionchus mayeri]